MTGAEVVRSGAPLVEERGIDVLELPVSVGGVLDELAEVQDAIARRRNGVVAAIVAAPGLVRDQPELTDVATSFPSTDSAVAAQVGEPARFRSWS